MFPTTDDAFLVPPYRPRPDGRTLTRRGVPDDFPLLAGRLIFTPCRRQEPVLIIAVWCPYCREEHRHGWPDLDRLDAATHRVCHCRDDGSPFRVGGYFVTPLPSLIEENRRVLAAYRKAMTEWEGRRQ